MTEPWQISTVGDEFDVQLGKMLDSAKNVGEPKKYLGNRAVQWGRFDIASAGTVLLTEADKCRYRVHVGDLLVCEGGEIGRAAIWRGEAPEMYFQKALHRLRPRRGYDVRLMQAFLEYWAGNGGFVNYATQTSIAHLPREKLVSMPLPLPPLDMQSQIAEALMDADDLIATTERLIAKKQAIKQGMMQQLLTGRTRLPGFTGKWTETRLGDILKFQAGFPFPSHQFSEEPSGVRLVRNRDLRSDDATVFIRGHVPGDYVLGTGDVLIGMDGDFEPVIWQGGPAALNQRVGRLRFSSRSHAGFIAYALVAPLKDLEYGTGATTVKHLSHSDVENLVMTIPPVAEQAAIAQVLIDSDVAIDALRLRLTKARAIKQGMMQELLTGRTRLPVVEGAG